MKEALYYSPMADNKVRCELCPHRCIISDGSTGICRVRRNYGGKLFAVAYEMISSIALDPIEKKPLDFFMPGANILSVGTYGCNFNCDFCQNYSISQQTPELERITVESLCETAGNLKGNIGIAFTYNEPLIWYEYVLEACMLNQKQGRINVLVTNGYINPEPLDKLLPYVDAMNIDLKAFKDDFYSKICGGGLDAVKTTIKKCAGKCHVELTNLSIPGMNDSEEEMDEMCRWIASIDKNIPLHLISFRPLYKMKDLPPQDFNRLISLRNTAMKYLNRVII